MCRFDHQVNAIGTRAFRRNHGTGFRRPTQARGTIHFGGIEFGPAPSVSVYADTGDALARGPMHIAFGPENTLYATSLFDSKIVRITEAETTDFIVDSELRKPAGLVFSKKGEHLFVASFGAGQLRRYDAASGAFIDVVANELPAPWAVIPR